MALNSDWAEAEALNVAEFFILIALIWSQGRIVCNNVNFDVNCLIILLIMLI